MKRSRKNRRILRAFLQSTLIVSCLLLCLLTGILLYITQTEHSDTADSQSFKVLNDDKNQSFKTLNDDKGQSFKTLNDDKSPSLQKPQPSENRNKPSVKSDSGEKELKPAPNTTVLFAGDVYFSDYVLANYNQSGIQGVLSKDLLKEMKQADLTVVNNEFPYSTRGTQAPDKQFTFRIDPSYVSMLLESGVDLVTLANNHVLDYGKDALSDTFQTLDQAGISYMGAGNSFKRAAKLITKKANGHKLGFLAASRVFPDVSWNVENAQPGVLSAYDPARLLSAVQDAQDKCDFLFVYVHWGIERNTAPEQYQVSLAHALIDAGADAVIGAHPHVLQGVEFYNGKPIFYSLGNFIFYQNIEKTAVVKMTLTADRKAVWQLMPAKASHACTSLLTETSACQGFYRYMSALSVRTSFSDDGTLTGESS